MAFVYVGGQVAMVLLYFYTHSFKDRDSISLKGREMCCRITKIICPSRAKFGLVF